MTSALARRATIGTWRAPDQSWSNTLTPLGDLLFGALASSLLYSMLDLIQYERALLLLFGITVTGPVVLTPLVAIRARSPMGAGTFGPVFISCLAAAFVEFLTLALFGKTSSPVVVGLGLFSYPVVLGALCRIQDFGRQHVLSQPLWRRRRMFIAWTLCSVLFPVALFSGGVLLRGISPGKPFDTLFLTLILLAHVAVLYPIWRFVGPAAGEIERRSIVPPVPA
jgi:hypothetical protein